MDRREFVKNSMIFLTALNLPLNAQETQNLNFRTVPKEQVQWLGNSDGCAVCGMKIDKFYKTTHAADVKGSTHQYCSINCMFDDAKTNNLDAPVNPKVVDVLSLKYIDAKKAFYVYGSSKPATMAKVSSYGFNKKEDALEFAKEFGGEILNYDEMSVYAIADIKEWAKIREKRKAMEHNKTKK